MRKFLQASLLSCVVVSLAVSSTASWADTPAAETESAPADKASNFVHCDGKPNKESSLGLAARLIAVSLVVGLFLPQPEEPDVTKRMKGVDGIKACDAALNGDEKAKDGGRRLELILGRAIHRMEIADWQGAIDDLHTLPSDQPELTSTRAYRQSLGQTAAYLEAVSLLAKGDQAGAVAMGYKIGSESPYDAYTLPLAARLVVLEDGYSAEKKALLDRNVRLNPKQTMMRAAERAAAGDFAGAADDYAAYAGLLKTMQLKSLYGFDGLAAVGYRLAGKTDQAEALFDPGKTAADADEAEGKNTDAVGTFREISDFYAIVAAYDSGQTMRARNMFSARSHWSAINYGFVAEMARRLQSVGTPQDQAQSPIQTPQQIVSDRKKTLAAVVTTKGDKGDKYWGYFIPASSDAEFSKLSSTVWDAKSNRYIVKKKDSDLDAQFIVTSDYGVGIPCAYALYMHVAVVAKSQGKSSFLVLPGQKNICSAFVRIGNAEDKDMVAPFVMDADHVIAELQPYFPKPDGN